MASTTFGLTFTTFLADGVSGGWDSRTVNATSYPINESDLTAFIAQACGVVATVLHAKGIDPSTITQVGAQDAFERVRDAVYLLVNHKCSLRLWGVENSTFTNERDRVMERLESVVDPAFGAQHKRNTEDRVDKPSDDYGFPS